jgi:signal transduction histidine kinase
VRERIIQITAAATGVIGLLLVWYLVETLWAEGWSMYVIHITAILGAASVTLAASLIVVVVVTRYRRILESKNQELQRLAAIGETVAELAHYQKNLLNGLRGGLYVTDGAMKRGDPEKLRSGWHMLDNSILRIERLTMDMLYYIKERAPRREPTDLNQVIEEVIDLTREAAASRQVELHAELDQSIDKQLLDGTALYRSLVDLVDNAIDACVRAESGGLVTLKTRADAGEIVVTVADNGIGMTDEVLANLFVRFFSTKGGQGTGLGLVVVKKIVEEHGGSLAVESKPGEGSAFHLHFPETLAPLAASSHLTNTPTEGEKNVGQEANTDHR